MAKIRGDLKSNKKNLLKTILPLTLTALFAVVIIILITRKSVCIIINGNSKNVITYKSNVSQVLFSEGVKISPYDKVTPALDSKVTNHSTITVKHAVAVNLTLEGKETTKYSPEDNVKDFLTSQGIVVGSEDKVTPEKEAKLYNGIKIDVVRVEHKTLSSLDTVAYNTIRRPDSSLPNTYEQTVQEGQNGEKQTIFDTIYENGKEISKKIIDEHFTKKPVDKIVVVGTFPSMPVSRGGQQIDYKKVIQVKSTAYYAVHGVGSTYTSSGRMAVRNPDGYSTIAVDPSVIPYGTKVFVEGYGFAVAADTGTAIRGNWIDVFFDTSAEARRWAVKYVKVYIL
ncbi:cell wall-binding protein YocH precursor [Desulfosporosinus acididurans]|uniref:Cell wall-binding protein YocH n=1 Tax=Desulfosporosinus acididurans TaxID=476652 RepID=A0A0J1FVF2_9FIRM|nr:3D domain-containing protein [Desulfosporosinus acididurans]KLU67419.1 cell wall-binding protein YocH precursor [Desulfosporosinus acididurans]